MCSLMFCTLLYAFVFRHTLGNKSLHCLKALETRLASSPSHKVLSHKVFTTLPRVLQLWAASFPHRGDGLIFPS